jgi:hypothetical protein
VNGGCMEQQLKIGTTNDNEDFIALVKALDKSLWTAI